MKKTLLMSMALVGGLTVFAQEQGTDVTPANYHFGTATEIPWFDNGVGDTGFGFCSKWNFTTNSRGVKGVWEMLGADAPEYYNNKKGLIGCAGGDAASEEGMAKILKGFNLVDLGGEVGQVLVWQGRYSKLKEELESNYPQKDWDFLPEKLSETEGVTGWNMNFWLDPNDAWTKVSGYYRCRMILTACHSIPENQIDEDAGLIPYNGDPIITSFAQKNNQGNMASYIYTGEVNEAGERVNKANNDDSDNGSVVPAVTNDLFIKRTASGTIIPNRDGDPMWDPTKWAVVDYYFNVAGNENGLDENGDTTTPVRIKMGLVLDQKLNNLAILIKDIKIEKFEGELTQAIYDKNTEPFQIISLDLAKEAGVESIGSDDPNAPVVYYNLQGVKVANPEKGIYIKKQGNKTSKVVL